MKFTDLNLNQSLLEALDYMGFETATPVQEKSIPVILNNKDILACAQTGTGKTAAFVLPILNKLIGKTDSSTNTLILVPTRELAIQIEQQIQGLSYFISVGSMAIYGGGSGKDFEEQKQALKNGIDIVVATPGKLLSHLKLGYVNFKHIEHFVLDEADRMLDMGFFEDIKAIEKFLPKQHQTIMFSATMPQKIRQLAHSIMHDAVNVSLSISKPAEGVKQQVILTFDEQKNGVLAEIINQRPNYDSIIIFSSSKSKVSEIVRSLRQNGLKSRGISSNLNQDEREEVLRGFRSKRIRIVVGTDVISRGIDVKDINLVINYDVPHDAEDYVHRIGRTARANTKGEAITLVNPKDMRRFSSIEQLIEAEVPKESPGESFGPGPDWKAHTSNKNKKKRKYYSNKKKKNTHSNKSKPSNN